MPATAGWGTPMAAAASFATIGSRSTLCRWHAIRKVMGICLPCSRCSGFPSDANPFATKTSTVCGHRVRISPTRMSGWMSTGAGGGACGLAGASASSSSASSAGAMIIVAPRLITNIATGTTDSPANRANPAEGRGAAGAPPPAAAGASAGGPARKGGLSRGEPIRGENILGDILAVYPETVKVFKKYYGEGCFSCPGQATESVKQSAMMHNVIEKQILSALSRAGGF